MKIKRFVVFEFPEYYPGGGWNNFVGSYDTVEEAAQNHPGNCQLVDLETGLVGLPPGYIDSPWGDHPQGPLKKD